MIYNDIEILVGGFLVTLNFKTIFKIGICGFILYLCIYHWPSVFSFILTAMGAASPLIVGCGIAFILNILMSFYEKHYFKKSKSVWALKTRRPVCLIFAILTLLAIITIVISLVLPQLISCFKHIFAVLPSAINRFIAFLSKSEYISKDLINTLSAIDWRSKIGEFANTIFSGLGGVFDIVVSTVTSVFSGLVTVFIGLIFAGYLLMQKEKLAVQCEKLMNHYIKESIVKKIKYVAEILNDSFRRYIIGQCTEAVILGVLCTLGMLILGLPYATMIGAFIAFTALIPIAGAYIGAGIGAFMIVMVSPVKALVFLIFILVLQQLEGNLIYPRVVGLSIGLPGIWVLAAITIGGGVMGVGGMLLGVPIAATIYRIIKNDVNKVNAEPSDKTRTDSPAKTT